jgi:hypothetical protein
VHCAVPFDPRDAVHMVVLPVVMVTVPPVADCWRELLTTVTVSVLVVPATPLEGEAVMLVEVVSLVMVRLVVPEDGSLS